MSANMTIDAATVKDLRDRTGCGMMDCKKALEGADGDIEVAITNLRKQGMKAAEKKSAREIREGLVTAYLHHNGRLGVLLSVGCETDFVSRGDDFQELARSLGMHIAAARPEWVSREDVPEDILEAERDVFRAQAADKPEEIQEKILAGKLDKFFAEKCLLEQPFVMDDSRTVQDVIKETIGKLGENITVADFSRFEVGAGR